MKRYDLRHLHDDFYDKMFELIDQGLNVDEVGIFMFEVGDYSSIQKSADAIYASGHELMNSLKFNEVDWTLVVKKVDADTAQKSAEAFALIKKEADEKAAEEAKIAAEREAEKVKKLAEKEEA